MMLRFKTLPLSWLLLLALAASLVPAQTGPTGEATQRPDGRYTREQIGALVAAAINGRPQLTDAIFGDAPLFAPQQDTGIPSLTGFGAPSNAPSSVPAFATQQQGGLTKLPDRNRGQVYDNGVATTRANLGVFNVADFAARDNDQTDSRAAIQEAIDAAAAEGGGIVRLSYATNGVYRISAPLIYKQGVILEGETSAVGAKVKLRLTSNNSNAITIGGNLTSVHLRNIELYAPGTNNSKGILFTGSGANATQIVTLDGLTINSFTRGISIEASDPGKTWQMSYASARNLVLHDCLYGIYMDAINSDWNFDNLLAYIRRDGYGVYVANGGTMQFNHPNFIVTTKGGPCLSDGPNPGFGEAAIRIEGHHGPITVINAQQEGFRKTFVQNREDWTYPIVFMNTVMAAPVELNADTVFVSIGNYYYDDTVQAKGDTRIYSMGDSIDSRTHCLAPGKGAGGFTLAPGAFMVKRETIYGTDYQMPVSINAAAPKATTSNPNNPVIPLLNIGSPHTAHVYLRLGQTDGGTRAFTDNYYDISRDHDGLLNFYGNQQFPYRGIKTNGTIKGFHYAGTGAAPTVTAGAASAVGSGASVSVTGTDAAFEVTLRTGSGVRAAGTLFTVNFTAPYESAPFEVFSASSPDSADLAGRGVGVFSTSTNTNVVFASRAAVSDSRLYKFKFQVKQ